MKLVRRHIYLLAFVVVLIFCSVMVIEQFQRNQRRHVELREAFILLHNRGYTNECARLYKKLLRDVPNLNNTQLVDDFQRTLLLVDPSIKHPENLIYNYHWYVSNELEKRSASTLRRALKLAGEE